MKRVIRNKVYDTDTAMMIGSEFSIDEHGFPQSERRLYRKKTGEFFLYGKDVAGMIKPLTYEDAETWARMYLSSFDFKWYFGEPDYEDAGTEVMTISIPASIARRIRLEAQRTGTTISGTIAQKFA